MSMTTYYKILKMILILTITLRKSESGHNHYRKEVTTKPFDINRPVIGMRRPPGVDVHTTKTSLIRVITPPSNPVNTLEPINISPCRSIPAPCPPVRTLPIDPGIVEYNLPLPCPTCGQQVIYYINNTHHHYYGGQPQKVN